jgi:hypothetical protein
MLLDNYSTSDQPYAEGTMYRFTKKRIVFLMMLMLWLAAYFPHLSAVEHLLYLRLVEHQNPYSDIVGMLAMPTLFVQYPGYLVGHWLGLDESDSAYAGYLGWLLFSAVNASAYLLVALPLALIAVHLPAVSRWIAAFRRGALLKMCMLLLFINISSTICLCINREAIDYVKVGVMFGVMSLIVGMVVCLFCYKWTRVKTGAPK